MSRALRKWILLQPLAVSLLASEILRPTNAVQLILKLLHKVAEGSVGPLRLHCFMQALKVTEKIYGSEDLCTAENLEKIAAYLQVEQRYAEALPYCQRAISIFERENGELDVSVIRCYKYLMRIYEGLSDRENLLSTCDRIAAIRKAARKHRCATWEHELIAGSAAMIPDLIEFGFID